MAQPIFPEYEVCQLCPRLCGVNRAQGQRGFCGQSNEFRVATIAPHFGEEPPISGIKGSGTVFLSGCSTGCFFCQNHQLSKEGMGRTLSEVDFMNEVRQCIAKGVHNLNFVTPDHFWPHLRWLMEALREAGETIPFLLNSSGYQNEWVVTEMVERADIFLPDFKFAEPELAKFCMGRRDYPLVALSVIEQMVGQKGFLNSWVDESGSECVPATKGVLVRHLVLPAQIDNSILALNLLHERFGRYLPISLMSQFHPTPYCSEKQGFDRTLTADEYDRVVNHAVELDFENLLIQPLEPSDEFYPDFGKSEPFAGNRKVV